MAQELKGVVLVETLVIAAIACSVTVVRSVCRCVEILVQAHADNERERVRRATMLTIMAAIRLSGSALGAPVGEVETKALEPDEHGT